MSTQSRISVIKPPTTDDVAEDPNIEYPSSDGEPMAENDWQFVALTYTVSALRVYFRERTDVYAAGDMFVYYRRNDPSACVAPDVYVVIGANGNQRRHSWFVWREGKAPDFVLEVASPSTWRRDDAVKREIYAAMGVTEYRFLPSVRLMRRARIETSGNAGSPIYNVHGQYPPMGAFSFPEPAHHDNHSASALPPTGAHWPQRCRRVAAGFGRRRSVYAGLPPSPFRAFLAHPAGPILTVIGRSPYPLPPRPRPHSPQPAVPPSRPPLSAPRFICTLTAYPTAQRRILWIISPHLLSPPSGFRRRVRVLTKKPHDRLPPMKVDADPARLADAAARQGRRIFYPLLNAIHPPTPSRTTPTTTTRSAPAMASS